MMTARLVKLSSIPVLLGAACLLATGCSKPEAPVKVAQPVQTILLQDVQESPFRRFPGEVMSARVGRLSFDVPGRLIEFPLHDGQVVKKGDLIGQLDPADFIARRDSAQATFNAAREQYDRNRTLRQRGVIAPAELDQRRRDFEVAEANLRTAQRALEDTRLVAPFDGRIAQRIARNSQNVQARELVAILEKVSTLEIEISLPERDMARAGRGITVDEARNLIEAKAEFGPLPGEQFDLTLESFATSANAASRTFLLTFSLTPPEGKNILPGMTCTVLLRQRQQGEIVNPEPHLYQVPVQTILTEENRTWVWQLDPKTLSVTRIPVEIIGMTGQSANIRAEKLNAGDELVSSGVRFLSEGTTVRRMEVRNP